MKRTNVRDGNDDELEEVEAKRHEKRLKETPEGDEDQRVEETTKNNNNDTNGEDKNEEEEDTLGGPNQLHRLPSFGSFLTNVNSMIVQHGGGWMDLLTKEATNTYGAPPVSSVSLVFLIALAYFVVSHRHHLHRHHHPFLFQKPAHVVLNVISIADTMLLVVVTEMRLFFF